MRNVKIYFASKLKHRDTAIQLMLTHTNVTFTNRWQFFENQIPDTKAHARNFWQNDDDDVRLADYVIVYGEEADVLKGAILEAGLAIAYGKPVICVGSSKSFGTWQWHPRVQICESIEDALRQINRAYTR